MAPSLFRHYPFPAGREFPTSAWLWGNISPLFLLLTLSLGTAFRLHCSWKQAGEEVVHRGVPQQGQNLLPTLSPPETDATPFPPVLKIEETDFNTCPDPGHRVKHSSENPPPASLNSHSPILAFGSMATRRADQEKRSDSFPGFISLVV